VVIMAAFLAPAICLADDWPQFRGPNRDGKSAETGLLKKWPAEGPKLLWSVESELEEGFASVAVADGYVYTTGMVGQTKQGEIIAYGTDGSFKWKSTYGRAWDGSHSGARSTPTVDGDRLYVMSGYGLVACHNSKTGKQIWKVDTAKVFEGKNIRWGIAESVLVYGDKVICTPGGKDAAMVALDKMTGKTIWTTKGLSEKSAYCSPVLIRRNDKDLVVTNVQKSIIIVDPDNGNVICRIPHEKRHDLAAVSPVYKDGYLYVTTGYEREDFPPRGRMWELSPDTRSFTLKWTDRNLDCHHGGVVLVDGDIHGSNSVIYGPPSKEKNKGTWFCLNLATGKIKYQAKLVGKGSVIYADGMLYCYGENGMVGLVKITPTGYELVSSFKVTKGADEHWAHPAISDGRLYIRHGDALMAYDIKAK